MFNGDPRFFDMYIAEPLPGGALAHKEHLSKLRCVDRKKLAPDQILKLDNAIQGAQAQWEHLEEIERRARRCIAIPIKIKDVYD